MFFDVSRTSVVAPAEPLLSTTLQDTVFTGNNVHGTTTTDATDKYELRVEYNKDQNVVQVYMVDKDKNDGKKLIGTYNGKDGSFTKTGDFDAIWQFFAWRRLTTDDRQPGLLAPLIEAHRQGDGFGHPFSSPVNTNRNQFALVRRSPGDGLE